MTLKKKSSLSWSHTTRGAKEIEENSLPWSDTIEENSLPWSDTMRGVKREREVALG